MLALWIQALAPALALRWDLASPAPLSGQPICGAAFNSADTGATAEPPQPVMPGCGHCGLCAAGVVTPVLPTLPRIALELRWRVVSWPIPPPARLILAPNRLRQARGPPALA